MDEGKGSWLIIPKSDYIDALAFEARGGNLAMEKQLQAWARKVYSESAEPIEERIYDLPSGLNRAILAGNSKVPVSLQRRRDRHAMDTGAEHGHAGEEAWTIMTMDGAECMSSGVHILRFCVGHMGYILHKRITNAKRKDYADSDQDTKTLLPAA